MSENFSSELKNIDWVLVVSSDTFHPALINFIEYLKRRGVRFQTQPGSIKDNFYITIHFPDKAIKYFSKVYNLSLTNLTNQNDFPFTTSFSLNITRLNLTENRFITRRTGVATTKERILIGYEALQDAKFGNDETEYGLDKLMSKGVVKTAYPLHDGQFHFDEKTKDDEMNDRQILLKYWANFSVWYKEQPLNLIEKYYGSEVAFYYAWLGFYNRSLLLPAVVGFLCFLISMVQLVAVENETVKEMCSSDYLMCPICHSGSHCVYVPLKDLCVYAKISLMFDNYASVAFAIFMSFWATIFLKSWKRRESVLKIKWRVEDVERDDKVRPKYDEITQHYKISPITGKKEKYTPKGEKILRVTLSYGACLFFITIVVFALFLVIMYDVILSLVWNITTSDYLETGSAFVIICSAAVLQVMFIKLLGMFYAEISEWLTNLENPRTQSEFDSGVVYKRYFLGFANNYIPLFYIAFFKGRFYTPMSRVSVTKVETDICHPCGCLMAVCIQVFCLMVMKSFIGNILTLIVPKITGRFKSKPDEAAVQWEEEFKLIPASRYLLTTEFMEMIIQYGFVTFFIATFPLAPLFALLNNIIELRLDALKLVTRYRRPIPKNQAGIGPWNDVLAMITHLGVATNAFVLAFTSDFLIRTMYRHVHGSLDGYMNWTLSVYDMNDYKKMVDKNADIAVSEQNTTICRYRDLRYPPDHPKKYELTPYFWYELGIRLVFVIIFEHVIWVSNGFLSYFIPDVSTTVREKIHNDKIAERNLKLKLLAQKQKRSNDNKNREKRQS